MNRRDIEAELSTTGAQQLLASTSAAHLAYIGQDGTPRVIPVGFFWTGDQAVVATATTAPKVAALSARPDVALSIDAGDTPDAARALSIRGRASVEIVDGVVPEYLAAARMSMDAPAAAEFERNVRGDVRPDGAHCDHTALGALLRLRCRPHAGIPAGTRRAEPVLTIGLTIGCGFVPLSRWSMNATDPECWTVFRHCGESEETNAACSGVSTAFEQ